MNSSSFGYNGLNAYTSVPEPNGTYLFRTQDIPVSAPMDGSTMGLMMILSTLQYQAPYVDPAYSNAFDQAGKAAFVESGGQAFQNKFLEMATKKGREVARFMGVTNTEMVAITGMARVVRDRQLAINGPQVYSVKMRLTLTSDSGKVELNYGW